MARGQTLTNPNWWLIVSACLGVGGCSASLPEGGLPQASALIDNPHATTIVGRPAEIYQRIARQAHRCWFGPFGQLRAQYMMQAEVPPPASSDPVTVTVHRRLKSAQKPWGPGLLRLELSGTTTTTLTFTNMGLEPAVRRPMTAGLTRWANGRTGCDEAGISALTGGTATEGLATGTTRQSADGRR